MTIENHVNTIYVTDQDSAKNFYTGILGYDEHMDMMVTDTFRWLSVTLPGKPDQVIALFASDDSGADVNAESAKAMTDLIAKGTFSAGVLQVADCFSYCDELRQKNVKFLREPEEKPWGVIEALIYDDSGNRLAVTSPISN